jgi:hypothetical protein
MDSQAGEQQLLTLQAGATRSAQQQQRQQRWPYDACSPLGSPVSTTPHGTCRDGSKSSSKKKQPKKPKADAYLQAVPDRKLRGQLKHTERLYKESNQVAARVNTWLAPADAGFIEAEGGAGAVHQAQCVLLLLYAVSTESVWEQQQLPTAHAPSSCVPAVSAAAPGTHSQSDRRHRGDMADTAAADRVGGRAGRSTQGV